MTAAPIMPRISGRALDWAMVGGGALVLFGLALVSRAAASGELHSTLISPWHAPLYAGILLALYALLAGTQGAAPGGHLAQTLPAAYRISGLGLVLFAIGFVGDIVWQALAGDTTGPMATITPTHLLAFAGTALIMLGPLRSPSTAPGSGFVGQLPAVLAVGLLLALGGGVTQWANPITQVIAQNPVDQPLLAGASEIWEMAPDGSAQTRLSVAGEGASSGASWSSDGVRQASTVWSYVPGTDRATATGLTSKIVVAGPASQTMVSLRGEAGWVDGALFSPDGRTLALNVLHPFAGTAEPSVTLGPGSGAGNANVPQPNNPPVPIGNSLRATAGLQWDIATASADSNDVPHAVLTDLPGTEVVTAWSPDGASLLYHSDQSGNFEIYGLDLPTGTTRALTDNLATDDWAVWSPDGRRIVFASDRAGGTHLWMMNADGSNQVQFTSGVGDDWDPAWSPDGRYIAFLSNRDGNTEIYRLTADGSDLRNLTRTPNLDEWLTSGAWSNGARLLRYSAAQPIPSVNGDLSQAFVAIILQSLLITGLVLLALRAGRLPLGAITIILTVGVATLSVISQEYELIAAAFLTGVFADLLAWWLRPAGGLRRLLIFGFVLPAVALGAYFAALEVTGGIAWSAALMISALGLAGVTGLSLTALSHAGVHEGLRRD